MTAMRIIAAVVLVTAVHSIAAGAAEEQATIEVASGRIFSGVIDGGSDRDVLVLRSLSGGITVKRPIRWERVVAIEVSGSRRDVAALRAEYSKKPPSATVSSDRKFDIKSWPVAGSSDGVENVLPPPQVATVAFDPQIANWDGDVETDGVVIDVTPLNQSGYVVPAAGTLEVELFAPQRRTLDLAPQSGGDTLELVERWTRAIGPENYGPRGARLLLPFGAITPELQPNWTASHYGLVHARLSIPGQGVFDYSRDGVRVRPWAPNRDRLEMKTGQRFLPTENLGRRD